MPYFSLSHRLNAREAQLLAQDAHASTLEYVHNQIYDACRRGLTVVTLCVELSAEIIHSLQVDGYDVRFHENKKGHGDFWVISWHVANAD